MKHTIHENTLKVNAIWSIKIYKNSKETMFKTWSKVSSYEMTLRIFVLIVNTAWLFFSDMSYEHHFDRNNIVFYLTPGLADDLFGSITHQQQDVAPLEF